MGNYATVTSMQVLMPSYTFNTATTSLVEKLITQAENEINKYVSKRYDISGWTTVASTPPVINTICEWLTQGYSIEGMSKGGKDATIRADKYIKRAMIDLKGIKDFNLDLVDSSGDPIDDRSESNYGVSCNTTDYSSTFNEDDPLNWAIDSDKLSDISTERG